MVYTAYYQLIMLALYLLYADILGFVLVGARRPGQAWTSLMSAT